MSVSKEAEEKNAEVLQKALNKLDMSQLTHHKESVQGSLKILEVDPNKGLSSNEHKARLERHGPNELEKEEEKTLWERIMEQFEDQLVRILLAAATITFIFACMDDGEEGIAAFVEPFVILTILILNGIVAIWQDSNADSALEALMKMQAQTCLCRRDGEWISVEAETLVPGDIVKVSTGDCVPADLRVIEIQSISLNVGQASLTGESVSVRKTVDAMDASAKMLQQQKNILFSSTTINQGNAIGVVAYTGMKTAIGQVHSEVNKAREDEEDTPLKQKLDQFSDLLAKVIFVICGLVWAMNFFKFWDPIHGGVVKGCIYYFKIAVALAVAAIPEGLPAVITTCLALGTKKMAANNCIVRKLPSVETLGCTSTICSDKTGTLTKNLMCATKFGVIGTAHNDLLQFDIEEKEYSPMGDVKQFTKQMYTDNKNFEKMAVVCAMNNRARIIKKEGAFERQGEPTEAALKVFAEKLAKKGLAKDLDLNANPNAYGDEFEKQYKRVATLDFTSERKTMSTLVSGNSNSNWVLLKGAPERVLQRCSGYHTANGDVVKF